MDEYYIGQYRDHYAIFDSMGRVQTQYDTHAEAKADLDSYNNTGKPLPEAASKDSVIDKAFKGPVNSMFDTTSKEFKKVGNDVGNDKKAKQTWWNDMKLTARMHKKPYPKVNGYTNGDFNPNHEWLMAAIEQCKSVADCECLIKDGYLAISQDKQLVKNLRAVKEGNPSRYVNVKLIQKRLDNGVTPEKVEKHIEWMKENYIKGLQAKKKEFKKSQNESTNNESMNEGIFGLGKKKEIPKVTVDEIKIIPTNFRKAYDNWWFYLPLKNNMNKDMLCDISNRIRKICNSEYGFDAYPTEFMVCSPKDIVREYKVDDYFDKEYLKNKNNIVICDYEFVGKSNIKSVTSLKQRLGARYFNDVVNNAVYYQIKDDPKNKGIPIPELINNSKNYAVSYIDKDTLMAMYNYFASRTSANESVSFYEHTLNEDHSEISNDPEMEKLLALAGCTIEDLDTINNEEDIELDDDDPIDANTSREIDTVMDESIGDFVRDTKNYFKNASEFLKHRKENSKSKGKDSEADIKNTPVYKEANKKLEAFGDSIGKKVAAHLKDYATKNNFKSVYKNTAFDINDIKYCPINGYDVQVSDLQDGIDYDRIPAWEEQNPGKDWQKEPQFNNDWYHELLAEGRDYAESLLDKDCPDIYAYDIGTGDGDEGLVYIDIFFTSSYINTIKEESKNSQNESAADDYHKNHEERMKNLNKKIDELNNDRKKDNEVREKQDKNAAALRDLLGESTPDLDFIMESIFMDIDH